MYKSPVTNARLLFFCHVFHRLNHDWINKQNWTLKTKHSWTYQCIIELYTMYTQWNIMTWCQTIIQITPLLIWATTIKPCQITLEGFCQCHQCNIKSMLAVWQGSSIEDGNDDGDNDIPTYKHACNFSMYETRYIDLEQNIKGKDCTIMGSYYVHLHPKANTHKQLFTATRRTNDEKVKAHWKTSHA